MFALVSRIIVLSSLLCLVGCGTDETSRQAVQAGEPETRQAPNPTVDEPLDDEELPDEEPLDLDVDEMDEHALEAACFAGQQAACDQLGH